ncbi:MAG TPA: PadR family transcriptional regulator [Solirubrobacteraceae bacterium]|nr:PadR family transcriptional regulator [Solirubrobacteraceae bacterium]
MAGKKKERTVSLVEGHSPVKAAALAVLLEDPTYGYEVAKRINRRMGPSWRVQKKHIYPVLKQLEADELVWSEERPIDDPPYRRRFYHPTEKAVQARREWLITPPVASIVRTDIHARLAFSSDEDIPELLRALDELRVDLLEEIEENAVTETPRVSWLGTIMSLYRSAVDKRLKAEVEWIGEACRSLEEAAAEQHRR